jgi:hypothetical protein
MKKFLFVCSAAAIACALTPQASADALAFNQITSPYTLASDNPADQGSNVPVVNATITNNTNQSIAITGIEFFLGGNFVSGASGDTPSEFKAEGNEWTYSLGVGRYSDSEGTRWSKNHDPDPGQAVEPEDGSTKNYLTDVTLVNSSSSGYCYIDDILGAGDSCSVELLVTPNYGGAMGSSDKTFIYGYAEGVEGKGVFTPSNSGSGGSWSKGADATVDNGMQERIEIDVAPEPRSLVLLGSGFALVGAMAFLRRRHHAAVQPTAA